MKRVLCLIDSLGAGGAQRQMVGLAKSLKDIGYKIVVAIYHNELFYADILNTHLVPYVCLDNASNKFFRLYIIAKYVKEFNPDVIISYLDTPNICGCYAKFLNRDIRLIVSERNTCQVTGFKEKIRFNLFRIADKIIPNSYSQAEYICNTFPFLTEKVEVIPNFVDLQKFSPYFHNRHEIPEIIVVATIWPPKNTLTFINAIDILVKQGVSLHVSWYGKDATSVDYLNKCEKLIQEKELHKYISLLDKNSRIEECYQKSDYFCLPSLYEGTPNVICEALASGLPIVCSDVCDNPLYVDDGENGFLFNPNDTKSIASAIYKILRLSDEAYLDFCNRSRIIAEQRLSKERFIESYLKLIE